MPTDGCSTPQRIRDLAGEPRDHVIVHEAATPDVGSFPTADGRRGRSAFEFAGGLGGEAFEFDELLAVEQPGAVVDHAQGAGVGAVRHL